MTNLFEFLKKLDPSVDKIFEYPILDSNHDPFAWSSIVRDKSGYPYSGGSDFLREIARLKALFEGIERAAIKSMYSQNENKSFLLDQFPSSNGFACGPTEEFALKKAIFEGFERYLWDMWIDKKISLEAIEDSSNSRYSSIIKADFENVDFYHCHFTTSFFSANDPLHFIVCVGSFAQGYFWGSQVNVEMCESAFNHALIEAHRNLKTFKSGTCKNSMYYEDRILQKFGENGQHLFSPKLGKSLVDISANFLVLQSAELAEGIWIARALLNGFKEARDPKRMAFW